MEAHYLATRMGLLPRSNVIVRTLDTGGAGPISGLLEADRMIRLQVRARASDGRSLLCIAYDQPKASSN